MKPCEDMKQKINNIELRINTDIKAKFKLRWLNEDLTLMETYCNKNKCPAKSCDSILKLHNTVYK